MIITREHLKWTIDLLRIDKIHELLVRIDERATESAQQKITGKKSRRIEPSRFGQTILGYAEQNISLHSQAMTLISEAGDPLLVIEAEQKLQEMWQADACDLFLGLNAWYLFPIILAIAARKQTYPYMPESWMNPFIEEIEGLSSQAQDAYFRAIDNFLGWPLDGEWILPLTKIGEHNLIPKSVNRIRIYVDMLLQAERKLAMAAPEQRMSGVIEEIESIADIDKVRSNPELEFSRSLRWKILDTLSPQA